MFIIVDLLYCPSSMSFPHSLAQLHHFIVEIHPNLFNQSPVDQRFVF